MWAHMPAYVHAHAHKDKFIHLSLPLIHGAHQGLLCVFLNQASKVQPKNLFASKVIQICNRLGSSKPSPHYHCTQGSMKMENRGAEGLAQGLKAIVLQPAGNPRLSAPSTVLTWDIGPLPPTPSSPEDQVEMLLP